MNSIQPQLHFVIGMHRSGTSAMAGLLDGMGLSPGRTVLPPTPENPLGYFENAAVVDFHDRFLKALGSSWHDPRPLGGRIRALPPGEIAEWRRELANVLAEQFEPEAPCVVKDPRICRLLPLWGEVLGSVSAPLVLVVRHPAAVAASLHKRDGFSSAKGLMLWLVNNLEMERESRGFPRVFVHYEDLLRDPAGTCQGLSEKFRLPVRDLDRIAADRVQGGLRHHGDSWPDAPAELRDWCQAATELLHRGASDCSALDGIFRSYEAKIAWLPDDFSGLAEDTLFRKLHESREAQAKTDAAHRLELEDAAQHAARLAARIAELEAIVESAHQWQRSWLRRTLHRWHPSKIGGTTQP